MGRTLRQAPDLRKQHSPAPGYPSICTRERDKAIIPTVVRAVASPATNPIATAMTGPAGASQTTTPAAANPT